MTIYVCSECGLHWRVSGGVSASAGYFVARERGSNAEPQWMCSGKCLYTFARAEQEADNRKGDGG